MKDWALILGSSSGFGAATCKELANKGINIIEVDTYIESAPITGAPLFNMKISISNDKKIDLTSLDNELKDICNESNLDILP